MHNRGWTQNPVGASLLAMTVGQMKGLCLTDRYREQAHSYRGRGVRTIAAGHKNLWEPACWR